LVTQLPDRALKPLTTNPNFRKKPNAGRYYIPTRYPNGLPDGIPAEVFTKDAAISAVSLAEEAVFYVKGLINMEDND